MHMKHGVTCTWGATPNLLVAFRAWPVTEWAPHHQWWSTPNNATWLLQYGQRAHEQTEKAEEILLQKFKPRVQPTRMPDSPYVP